MKKKHNVRHVPKAKAEPQIKHPQDIRDVAEQAADQLFIEREGGDLVRMRDLMKRTLRVYEQDLDRAEQNENPEKFKWRVKPTELIRLRKELKDINKEIEELRQECWKIARDMIENMMTEEAELQPHPEGPPITGEPQPAPGLENPEVFRLPDNLTSTRPPGSNGSAAAHNDEHRYNDQQHKPDRPAARTG